MNFKELGKTGISIPEIGIGTWDYDAGPHPLRTAIERCGTAFIDTAESYGTEDVVGEAVAGLRDRVFLATKVSPHHFRRDALKQAVDGSLSRLRTDRIDLLQLHHPNPSISIEVTMGAMAELVGCGKVRFLGVSNFSVAELQAAQKALPKYPIVSNQVRYNLIDRTIESELLGYCQNHDITVIAYSPLARDFSRIADCDPQGVLAKLARDLGKSPAQIVLNWCVCKTRVVAIPKANSAERILENCGASGWCLTQEQVQVLDANIQYRSRGTLDRLLRTYTPHSLRSVALKTAQLLPRNIRRRLT